MDESRRVLGVCHGCIVLSDKVTTLRATLAEKEREIQEYHALAKETHEVQLLALETIRVKDAAIRAVNSWCADRFYLQGDCGGCVTYHRANRQHHPDCRYAKWLALPAVASALAEQTGG